MRIAYVNQDPGIGPGRRKGAAVHVVALQRAFRDLGCEVRYLDERDDAALAAALAALLDAGRLDLVYERQALGATAVSRFCARTRVPHFVEVNAPLIDEAREHRGLEVSEADLEAERMLIRQATQLFPVSTAVAGYLRERGAPGERVHVTPNGVDVEVFQPGRERPPGLDLPRDAFVLGFHGRLRPWHNFGLLARAFATLVARGCPVHLLAIGEGDFDAHLTPELRARTTLLRWMDPARLGAHVACFHALPLTYSPDSACYFSPLKLLEAMACGVVPLVPDLGDLAAAVDGGGCGVVYPAGDARALADALGGLIERPESRERLARAAVERARSRSWTQVAREILALAPGACVT